jgi:two-component system CheB/CheR fusion protein
VSDGVVETQGFEELLGFIKESRGFDFTGYKRPSVERRILKRMETVGIHSYGDYHAYLEANADEYGELFDTILINVTGFFRDAPAWEYLSGEIVPRLLAARDPLEPLRIWSTGCATGEEAYTVAMVLAEALGDAAFRDRVKVYATDVDEAALAQARHARYTRRDLEPVARELRDRYFDAQEGGFAFRSDLRRAVVFGRHDLVRDPPISRVDLVLARNVLMYFNPQLQAKIVGDFHFALREDGYLFVGKSEMLLARSRLFVPVELKHRLFSKVPSAALRAPRALPSADGRVAAPAEQARRLGEAGFESVPVAHLVADPGGRLVLANSQARRLFGIGLTDLGRPLRDLELSFRPLELRARIDEVLKDHQPVAVREVEWATAGRSTWFDVQFAAVAGLDGTLAGVAVTFTDVSRYRRLHDALEVSKERLETAYEELQSTSEELETTNEELQSTNEELETTNEELQSTNEELETMNEELQSTNEELETMNDELRSRSDDLNEVNAFLESILGSFHAAVVVVDAELRIQAWNHQASELWGLRIDEVLGQHLLNLDIGLPVGELRDPIRAAVAVGTPDELEVEALNRRGRTIACTVTISALRGAKGDVRGAIILMEDREEGPR